MVFSKAARYVLLGIIWLPLSLVVSPKPAAPAAPTAGLVGYWSFDDGTAVDNSGNGNDGSLVNGPSAVAGESGQALNFNGNQYVNVGNVLNPGTGDLSVFAWVKTTQAGGFNMIVSKRDSSGGNNSGYQLFQNSSGGPSFTFADGNSGRVRVDATGPRINDGAWHLVGVVFTRSGSGVLYVDGAPASNGSGSITSQSSNATNSLPLRFGTENQNSNSIFNWVGSIDEVRIYNRALAAQDISDLYNAPTSPLSIVTTSPLANGTVNTAYNQTLSASGGTPGYTWSLAAGSPLLPSGLTLSTGGIISGTPTTTGTTTVTVQVQDSTNTTTTKSLTITIDPPSLPLTAGLVGYWSFDDGTAADNSGNGNNGSFVNGPSAVVGKSGQALNFNGNQYVNVGNVLNPGTSDLSVFAWVKTTQAGGFNMIVSKRDSSGGNNSGYQLFQNGNGAPSFTFGDGNSTRMRVDSSGPRINDGAWHLVGVVFTRSGSGVLYVDGAPASNGSGSITSQSSNVSNALPLRFGTENQNSNSIFNWVGSIDEVRIYNRALAAQDISDLYNAPNGPLTVLTSSLPNGTVNTAYSQTLSASGGSPVYSWSLAAGSPLLPSGLTLSSGGVISGTPTTTGTTNFTVQVQDTANATATKSLSITINPQPLTIVTSSPLPNGKVNVAYNQTLSASGGTSGYSWSLAAGSPLLPSGLTFSTGGIISGTPTTAGTTTVTVQVQDSANTTTTKSLSITIDPPSLPLTAGLVGYWSFDDGTATDNSGNGNNGSLVNSPSVVVGKSGQALNFNGNQYVNVGNVLNPGTGDLSVFAWVKTTQAGGFNMIVSKRDSSGGNNSGYQLFQNGSGGPSFTFADGNSSRVRVDSSGPRINDGAWHLVGVVFTRSGSGVLYVDGAPASNGSGSITSQSSNAANALPLRFGTENQNSNSIFNWVGSIDEVRVYNRALAAQDISDLYNAPTSPLSIVTASPLPNGTLNTVYSQTLSALGGSPAYSWSLAAGSPLLPSGLTLSSGGVISGTPTTAGTTAVTVQVQDTANATATKQLSITINPQPLTIVTGSPLPNGKVNVAYSQTLSASGGSPGYSWSLAAGSPLLPSGLTLSSGGIISGTPTTAGTTTVTVQVQDTANATTTKSLTITIDPASLPLTAGLVGYWSFDDGTATDNSGNGNNGSLVNGPSAVVGKSGQALNFNGSQYVNVGNVLNPGTGDLSVFAWVKTTQAGGFNMIVSKRDSSGGNNSGYQLFQNGSGGPSFTFGDGNSSRVRVDSSGPRINDGAWHLVGVVFTRSGNGVLYVDGAPASNGAGSITSQSSNAANALPLRFGTENQNSNSIFNWVGSIDEVRVYNRALAAQDISDLYNAPTSPLSIATTSPLPNGTLNTAYSQTLSASGGSPAYSWSLAAGSPLLPSGLTLSSGGLISGTPTTIGTTTVTVQVQDTANATVTKALSITITDTVLVVTSPVLPSGQVNVFYNQSLTASGGISPYNWSLIPGSSPLPKGLSLFQNGTISGIPIELGTAVFAVQVHDSGTRTSSQTVSLTIQSSGVKPLVGYWSFNDGTATDNSGFRTNGTLIGNPMLVPGKIGQAFSFNGTSQYIETGLELDAGSGDLSIFAWVKTAQSGGSHMIVSKRDSSGPTNPGYQLFQNANGALSFIIGNRTSNVIRIDSTGPQINDGNWHLVGVVATRSSTAILYVDGTVASNGTGDISSIAGNDTAADVTLRFGVEQQTNPAFFWQGLIDEVRIFTRRTFTAQEVSDMYNEPLTIISNALPPAANNVSYNQNLAASGGTPPYTWSIAAGSASLPSGLSLSPSGTISGTPTTPGTFSFTVRVDDNSSHTTTQTLSLTVNGSSPQILLTDNFSGNVNNWTAVDDGSNEGPSHWIISNGEMIQLTNVFGGTFDPNDPVKPGTYVVAGNASWQDYSFSLRLMSEDNDGIGIMFRVRDGQNYYRFSMDSERHYRRLVKVVNGVTIPLIQDAIHYELGRSYDVRVAVAGSQIRVYMNQQLIFDVSDASITAGKVALYCWGNEYSHFGDVLVTNP